MLKNKNGGYLLTETLIAITVVATVITLVYAMTMSYYTNRDNSVSKFNTPQGLYDAQQIKKLCSTVEEKVLITKEDFIANNYTSLGFNDVKEKLGISEIYFSKSDLTSLINNESIPNKIKRYLTEYNEDTINKCEYRYVVIYDDDSYSVVGSKCD